MSEDDAIKIMNGSNLVDKRCFIKKKLLYIKMNEYFDLTYFQRNRDVMLNRAKDYYENDKERLRKQARDKYRNLSEEKILKREYEKNRYHNMSEEKKKRLKQYQKNYRETKKSKYNNK